LAATLPDTVPLPLPLAPDVMAIHDALLVAVQAQPPAAETDTVEVPPDASTAWLVGAIEKEHVAAACVTVKV
jgi:hypothetical protein